MQKEEHIVIVQEPGSKYLGYITPDNGTSKVITNEMHDFLKDAEWKQVRAIGSDGTNVNTGKSSLDLSDFQ